MMSFPGGSDGEELACNAGGPGLIPGWGRLSEEGNGYPPQYSCLGNSMDRETGRGYSLWDCKKLDMMEPLSLSNFF